MIDTCRRRSVLADCALVPDVVLPVLSTFGVVFLAELGDKTQLLALGFGARFRLRTVALGLLAGYAAAGAIAAVVGGALGASLPERPVGLVAGGLFLLFGVLTLRGDDDDGADQDGRSVTSRSALVSIAATISIAEMGDKTQLATATLAARSNPLGVWIGATAGALAAGAIGAVAGSRIGAGLDARLLRLASAALFAGFGSVLLITAW
jgi:putative Ca2+/H+ antiporter (TMEM165/GDT1 family)